MTIRSFLRDFPSPRTTRLGLLLGVPLSLLLGPRLVAWADVRLADKKWTDKETLTAQDLNDTFAALKATIDEIGQERTVRATITCYTPTPGQCSVKSQTGSWVATFSRQSAGQYKITIPSNTFSGSPSCAGSQLAGSSGGFVIAGSSADGPGFISVNTRNTDNMDIDMDFTIICAGAR